MLLDRRIEVFHTVAKVLNFTRAGEMLHMSQPAVTFQIRQLENHLGTPLFVRAHSGITLTPEGENAFDYARRIVALYNELNDAVYNMVGEIKGLILIGASSTIAEYMLPGVLGNFQAQFPDVKFRLTESNSAGVLDMVVENEVDLGIIESPMQRQDLVVRQCWEDTLVFVCKPGHVLSGKSFIKAEDLIGHPIIAREEGSGTRSCIDDYLSKCGVDLSQLDVRMEFTNTESIKNAVESALGCAIVSEAAITKEMQFGTLACIPMDPPITRPFNMIYQPHKYRIRALEEFMSYTAVVCKQRKENLKRIASVA